MLREINTHTMFTGADEAVEHHCEAALQEAVTYIALLGLVRRRRGVPGLHPGYVPNFQPSRLPREHIGKAYADRVHVMGWVSEKQK